MKNERSSLTLITPENIRFFKTAVGKEFSERKEDDLFIGIMDEKGAAAAAAAFREEGGTLYLKKIASDEAHRGKGYAYDLLEEMKMRCKRSHVSEIGTHLFYHEGEENGPFVSWLLRQGFELTDVPAKRYGFLLSDLYEKQPFGDRKLRKGEEILPKRDKVYGYELRYDGRIMATLVAEPFREHIYLSLVDAKPGHWSDVKLLMDEALKNIRGRAPEAEMLYTDIMGYRLIDYVERSLKDQGIEVKEELQSRYAAYVMEETSYE